MLKCNTQTQFKYWQLIPVKLVMRIKDKCIYLAGVILVFLEGYFTQNSFIYYFND